MMQERVITRRGLYPEVDLVNKLMTMTGFDLYENVRCIALYYAATAKRGLYSDLYVSQK